MFYPREPRRESDWSDPRIIFVFVLHKRLFVFVQAIRLCAVPELNFVAGTNVGRDSISGL